MLRFADPGGRMYGAVGAANANLLAHWTIVNGASWLVSAGNGRAGGSCLRWNAQVNGNISIIKTLGTQATYGIAMAFNFTTAVPTSTALTILGFMDAGAHQVDLRLNPDLTLQFTRNGTAIGSVSSVALTQNTWYHLEAKVTFHNTAGSIELRVNGIPRIGPTGSLNTRNTANNSANALFIANAVSGTSVTSGGWLFDDIVMWDTQPNDANGFTDISDFIGDCAVSWLPADGAGATTQFSPSAGSNFQCVDDTTPNGDTDYVESAVVGNFDTYTCANLPVGSSAVKSLAVVNYARKTDTGSRGMKAELRSNGGEATHPTEIGLADNYAYYMSNYGRDPNNGSVTNWTVAAVNALEIGQKVSS